MLACAMVGMMVSMQAAVNGPDFFVSPKGDDGNPGTREAPFATIGRAKDAVRGLVQGGLDRDILVCIEKGSYILEAPLVFSPEDSGTEEHAITYACAEGLAVISGGREVAGWEGLGAGKWQARLPDAKDGAWRFRQVFAEYRDLPDEERPKNDDEKRDQWLVRFSRAVGRDLGPFFEAWGIPTSQAARDSVSDLPDWVPESFPPE